MAWISLIIAGLLEVVWAVGLKYTEGFSRLVPSIVTVGGMIASFFFLSLALKSLPLGTAYAVWTGIGTIGTVTLGMIFFKEPVDMVRILFIMTIIVGITGLKVTAGH